MANALKPILFVIYLALGIYQLNFAFNFVTLPSFDSSINNWIIAVAGILLIIGGLNYLRASRTSEIYPRR
mgnify:CR=1 FL=1